MAQSKAITVLGIAWYRPEQWGLFRQLATDSDQLHDTYEEWQRSARKVIREMRRKGIITRPVDVDVIEMMQWCQERGLEFNGAARSEYAAYRVAQEDSDQES